MSVPYKVLFLVLHSAVVFSALPEVEKCQLRDSNCIKSSAQSIVQAFTAGAPEVGTETLDPMLVEKINVDLAGLKMDLWNTEIRGLAKTVIDKLNIDMNKKMMQLVYRSDFVLKGPYKASGRLLILPISGDGQTTMKLKNCEISMEFPFTIAKNKDGRDIIELKSYTYKYDVKNGASFRLTNLFGGNKAASDTMHTFMNNSWKLLAAEFGTPVFDTPMQKVFEAIKTYLSSRPLEEITA